MSKRVREETDAKALCEDMLALLEVHRRYSASLSAYWNRSDTMSR